MRHCVHDGLGHDLLRNLVGHGRLDRLRPRPNAQSDLAHYEVHCLIHKLEDRPPVHLVGGDRFGNLDSVEVRALDLRRDQEALRSSAEKQHGGVREPPPAQQVQMPKQVRRGSLLRQRELSRSPRHTDEAVHALDIQVVERGT